MLTTKNNSLILITTLIAALVSITYSFELPFLQTCTFEDEKCHIEKVDKFFEMYANGIEELDVPTFDPMLLGNITINGNSNENFSLKLLMENVILLKFPKVKCLSIKGLEKAPTKSMRVVLKMFSPQLIVKSHCHVHGKLLLFTVAGETDLKLDLKNVTTIMTATCTPYMMDGVTYLKVDKLKPKLEISSLSISFANSTLFNGEEVFMETFAATINENWRVLRDEIEPQLNNNVAEVARDALNKIFPTIPLHKFFKKSE